MGSEKFPTENDYDAFLTAHGGSSNAFTELEFTNFHFDVQPAALRGALERFAQVTGRDGIVVFLNLGGFLLSVLSAVSYRIDGYRCIVHWLPSGDLKVQQPSDHGSGNSIQVHASWVRMPSPSIACPNHIMQSQQQS